MYLLVILVTFTCYRKIDIKQRIVNNVEFKTFTIKNYVVPYCTEDIVVFSELECKFFCQFTIRSHKQLKDILTILISYGII